MNVPAVKKDRIILNDDWCRELTPGTLYFHVGFRDRLPEAVIFQPHAYLSLMFEKLPNAKSDEDFEALLPWNLKSGLTAGSQSPSPSRESME